VRPVNLIPEDERRGDSSPLRTGPAAYLVVGVLAAIFLVVVMVAYTGKQIDDKTAEKQALEQELTEATAKTESLREFAEFRSVHDTRTATVRQLAESRFDWERVMRELSLVIPDNVWLVNLTGTASPAVALDDGAEIAIRDTVAGPALELIGCTTGQDDVAAFVAALEDIDGVTRVGFESSEKGEDEGTSASSGSEESSATSGEIEDCRTREFIYQFKIVVAFDAVPAPPTAAPGVPAPTTPPGDTALADTGTSGG
jgi:Tfp pilus assembly protein PilN